VPRPRFLLRWKIAAFAAGLVALCASALAVFTVYLPWRQKLLAQEHAARTLAQALAPQIVRITTGSVHWNANAVQSLVANSHAAAGGMGLDVVYALLYDEAGNLDVNDSSANPALLQRISPRHSALYMIDRDRVLRLLSEGGLAARINPIKLRLATPDKQRDVGHLELGVSTASIDAEARAGLLRGLIVLASAVLVGMLGALLMAARIVRPLVALQRAMGHLGQGDFEQELREPAQGRDEIGDLARAFNQMAVGLRERERLKGTLGRYVSGDVAERILAERDDLSLRGELRAVTVLFLDVRGFTTVSERLKPEEVLELLNEYFDRVVHCVKARGGSVNKFIGDAAMCLWGAPKLAEHPERDAVLCALEIQEAARKLSEERRARGLTTVGIGIGINAGEVIAGNLGASERLEYTVIGDAVNLAQRLESQAREGEVLVSQQVYEKVVGLVEASERDPVKLKGKSRPVPLWEVRKLRAAAATEAA
jgi:class 3 adenylate cyclase